jgi:hypothetical protein
MAALGLGCKDSSSPTAKGSGNQTWAGGRSLPQRLGPSRGQVRYVAPWGSNSNPGTRGRPWRTIQRALDTLRPGQQALVRRGVYRQSLVMERAGTAAAPITIRAYPGERPVIQPGGSGSMDYPVRLTAGAAYVRLAGFVVEGAPLHSTMNVWISDGQRESGPSPTHHIEISGCEIRAGTGTGLLVSPNTQAVQLIGNNVHDNGDGSRQHQGIYFQGQGGLIANNLVYHQTNGFGIQVRGNFPDSDTTREVPARDVIVTNNTVVDNSLSGIMVENSASEVLVVNNVSALNGSHGVVGYDNGSGGVLAGNRAYNNLLWDNSSGPAGNSGRSVVDLSRGNIVTNPRFVDPQRRNYRLRAGSPAANRALPAFAPPLDRTGRRRSKPDLGAYER